MILSFLIPFKGAHTITLLIMILILCYIKEEGLGK